MRAKPYSSPLSFRSISMDFGTPGSFPLGCPSHSDSISWIICADMHPMVIMRVEAIPLHSVVAMEQHARLARPASPEHSWAPSLSGAHRPMQQLVKQQQIPAWKHVCIMFPKKDMHLDCLTSVGSKLRPRSCRKTRRLTSKAQHELQIPASTQTSKHRNRLGQSCSP